MSTMLEKAQKHYKDRRYKLALDALEYAEADVRRRDDMEGMQGVLDLALAMHCDNLAIRAQWALDRAAGRGNLRVDLRSGAMAVIADCRLIGGSGFDIENPSKGTWDVIFKDDQVSVLQVVRLVDDAAFVLGQTLLIEWDGLTVVIGGAGAMSRGGEFFGGGFGVAGAAAGMLAASALNALTTSTGIDTVIHLEAPTAELFLHYDKQTPEVLRRRLSPVFTRLRQGEPRESSQNAGPDDHVVDRLQKLADLLDRGLLTRDEFAQLKADLLSGGV